MYKLLFDGGKNMEIIPEIQVTNHIDIAHHTKGQNCQVANFFKCQQISYTAAFLKCLEIHVCNIKFRAKLNDT